MRRFDAGSYVVLSEAMNSHDVGRGRGGVRAALGRVTAPTLVAGVDSDRLYPLSQQAELAAGIPTADAPRVVGSPYGHDGFLIEVEQVAALVAELLPAPPRPRRVRRNTTSPSLTQKGHPTRRSAHAVARALLRAVSGDGPATSSAGRASLAV